MATPRDGWATNALYIFLVASFVSLTVAAKYKRPPFCETLEMVSGDKQPKSFLWSISERVPPAYFFGTIHVPYTRVWDFVPENVKEAFTLSDNVFFELDLMDPYTIAALANCQMLPSGEILADVLPGDVYERLERHLNYVRNVMPTWLSDDQRGRGLYADYLFNAITGNWQRKRPVWIMLMVNSLTENDIKSRGIPVLDLYLAQEAQRMDKKSGAVERVEEQCLPLNGLNFTQVLFALNQTLLQQESLRAGGPYPGISTDDLIKHYNCGDLNAVYIDNHKNPHPSKSTSNFTIWPQQDMMLSRNVDQYFKDELVHKRNVRMGERVLHLLKTYPDESFFFAFGAGHFLGENTVLDYVVSKGLKVEQIAGSKKIHSSRKSHHHSRHRHKPDKVPFNKIPWNGHDSILRPSSASRPGRRRYRKQRPNHPHHHAGVQLLRTSTSASAKTKTQRTFNDLWVKLDADTPTTSKDFKSSSSPTQDFDEFEQSLMRMWYGDSKAAQNSCSSSNVLRIMCVILLLWISVLKTR